MRKAESVPEKGKQLSRKAADKLKFYGVAAVLSLLCAGFIWFIFKPDTTETVEGTAGINTTIPDAIAPETMTDKQKAYELERMKKRRQEKVRTLQDIAGDYLIPDTSDGLKPEKAAPEQDAIRESRQQQQQISRQIASFYQEPKDNPRVSDLERQVKELNEKLERERKGQDPLELMEKSYEMAARYFPGQAGGQVKSIQSGGPSGNPAALFRRFCQGRNAGQGREKPLIIRLDRLNPGLLQHNLADPNAVWLWALPPGQYPRIF